MFREGIVVDIEGTSSSLIALELARIIGLKGKLKSPFMLIG
jgi:hypothetical protein